MTHEEALLRCKKGLNALKEDNRNHINQEVFVLLEKKIQNLKINKDKDWWQDYLNCQKGLEAVAWLSTNTLKPSHHKEISPRVENSRETLKIKKPRIENKAVIKKIVKKQTPKLVLKKKAKNNKIKLASKKVNNGADNFYLK